jgi:hypothetical protein
VAIASVGPAATRSRSEPLPNCPAPGLRSPATFLTSTLPPLRERAVNPTPATASLAPSRSTAPVPANSIENYVGQRVATVAATILEALHERQDGGLSPATRTRGGDLLAALHGLRLFMLADWDFDAIARQHGAVALRAVDVSPTTAAILVDEVLILLHKIARAAAN